MSETKNIYQRVIAVREKARYVQKDLTIAFGSGYKAVSHDAVVAAVRQAMDEEGIVLKLDYDHERSQVHFERGPNE